MAQQRLYTEKQVRRAIKSALDGFGIGQTEDTIDVVVSKLIPIKLPNDEEIEMFAFQKYHDAEDSRWFEPLQLGAKWMREQILNK